MRAAPMRLVLDTNVVLDWLVFEDKHVAGLRQAVVERRVVVVTYALTLNELLRVLAFPKLKLEASRQSAVFEAYRAEAQVAAVPEGFAPGNLMLPKGFPRCRDREDEKFLALAYHGRADALVSKDRDLLRLKKKAAKFGVNIGDVPALDEILRLD